MFDHEVSVLFCYSRNVLASAATELDFNCVSFYCHFMLKHLLAYEAAEIMSYCPGTAANGLGFH